MYRYNLFIAFGIVYWKSDWRVIVSKAKNYSKLNKIMNKIMALILPFNLNLVFYFEIRIYDVSLQTVVAE